jgi:hypothetical protein
MSSPRGPLRRKGPQASSTSSNQVSLVHYTRELIMSNTRSLAFLRTCLPRFLVRAKGVPSSSHRPRAGFRYVNLAYLDYAPASQQLACIPCLRKRQFLAISLSAVWFGLNRHPCHVQRLFGNGIKPLPVVYIARIQMPIFVSLPHSPKIALLFYPQIDPSRSLLYTTSTVIPPVLS